MGKTTLIVRRTIAAGLFGVLVGCGASTAPSVELVNAREAYDDARMGGVATVVPTTLHEAEQALVRAERAHEDDPGSDRARHLAYVAERKALMAMADAERARAENRAGEAEIAYRETLEQHAVQARASREQLEAQLTQMRQQLTTVQTELSHAGEELTDRTEQLRAQEQELTSRIGTLETELQSEQTAREDAERRAQQAMQTLQEMAQVREEQDQLVITLSGSVLFASGEDRLLPIAEQRLDMVVDALEGYSGVPIVIEGHTDAQGTETYNRDLSQRRAEAVRSYLIGRGIPENRLQAVGRGEEEPIAENNSTEGRANNRRVEIILDRSGRAVTTR